MMGFHVRAGLHTSPPRKLHFSRRVLAMVHVRPASTGVMSSFRSLPAQVEGVVLRVILKCATRSCTCRTCHSATPDTNKICNLNVRFDVASTQVVMFASQDESYIRCDHCDVKFDPQPTSQVTARKPHRRGTGPPPGAANPGGPGRTAGPPGCPPASPRYPPPRHPGWTARNRPRPCTWFPHRLGLG